jgi:ubiquinone/menaquinone biosynthesis C-methylase UbiE
MSGKRFPSEKYRKLESASRFKILPPDKIVSMLNLKGDENIADLGCGTGVFTLRLAEATSGKVCGVDVSSELLERARKKRNRENIRYIQTPIENFSYNLKFDLIFFSMVFHEVDREALFKTVSNIAAPSFNLAVIEWRKAQTSGGPPLRDRISSQELRSELENRDFRIVTCEDLNESAYFILASKEGEKKDE